MNNIELITIEEYKNVDLSTLRKMNLNELIKIYQGEDASLISDVKKLYLSYKGIKNKTLVEYIMDYHKLKEHIKQYDDAIDCFLNFNHVFFIFYTHSKDEYEKGVAFSYIGSSQVHLTKLQSQYNQLVYRKQRIEYFLAMAISIIALIATVIFGTISIPHK